MAPHHTILNQSSPQGPARSIQISKSLSWLLRHGATKERIPITADGYVKLADVLQWGKLRAMHVGLEEVVEVVQSNEKQRFGLRWEGEGDGETGNGVDGDAELPKAQEDVDTERPVPAPASTPHTLALAHLISTPTPNPSLYSIRAVQGHSLKSIDAPSLLTRITPESIPSTCVHGTFFTAWADILRSGGLKAMGRNHVHFAGGPGVKEVLGGRGMVDGKGTEGENGKERENGKATETGNGEKNEKDTFKLKDAMSRNAIVSGMRGDAEVLIYVDIRRAMEAGMEWYFSENGVILTDGVSVDGERPVAGQGEGEGKVEVPSELEETEMMLGDMGIVVDGNVAISRNGNGEKSSPVAGRKSHSRRHSQQPRPAVPLKTNANGKPQKLVPTAYWDIVVGIGVGVLWERGKGVVRDVPGEMVGRGKRGGRGGVGGGGNRGRGGNHIRNKSSVNPKPRMRVERDDLMGFD